MTITYPMDLLANWPGWCTDFDLLYRQEQSRQANGVTKVKDFGSPLWRASYATRSLSPNELDEWRARLAALENGLQQFRGVPLSRCYPIAYPKGSWPTGSSFNGAAALASIGTNRKSVSVKSLPEGFAFRTGDMIQIGRNLHSVQEPTTASSGGITGSFEIRPHLWPETVINDVVSVKRPFCLMTVVPGSITSTADLQTGRGSVSFQAVESR